MWKTLALIAMPCCAAVLGGGWDDVGAAPLVAQLTTDPQFGPVVDMPDRRAGRLHVDRDTDGLFYLTLSVEGTPVRFIVDTGATVTVLSAGDAARAGIYGRAGRRTIMAVGGPLSVRTAILRRLATPSGRELHDFEAVISPRGGSGVSLLGQDALARLGRITLDGDGLILS